MKTMKLLLFLAVMMMPGVNANAQTSSPFRGDANGDGIINAADIVEIVNIIMNGDDRIPKAVDLGLPSGTLWANMNVGASKPEDYGAYFAWGETTPHSDNYYRWESYMWCKSSNETLTKYCTDSSFGYNGFTDNKIVLLPEDDAATANWGSSWCIPTCEQFDELISNTTSESTTLNGIKGLKFTSKINGKSIFFPAAGYRWAGDLRDTGSGATYWSSTLVETYPSKVWRLSFDSEGVRTSDSSRCTGCSVRPVRKH